MVDELCTSTDDGAVEDAEETPDEVAVMWTSVEVVTCAADDDRVADEAELTCELSAVEAEEEETVAEEETPVEDEAETSVLELLVTCSELLDTTKLLVT